VATTVEALGLVYWRAGREAEAAKLLERSAAIYQKLHGPEASPLARVYSNMGGLRIEQKDFQGALEPLRRALAINEKLLGGSHPDLAEELSKLALAYLGLGRAREALAPLERVHRMLDSGEKATYGHEMRVQVHLSLGRALWELGRERARARTLVHKALALGRAAPDTAIQRGLVAEAERWLATH
jgi:tetratricopeptide (TPR) repeat protein